MITFDLADVRPGDVIAVRTRGWAARLINVGSVLGGGSGLANHVCIAHHTTDGVPWAVEGRPGGVGWADLRRYAHDPHTVANIAQPKSDAARAKIATLAETALGRPYDWAAIGDDALDALHIPALFGEDWHGQGVPGHVVCSSLAAYLYGAAGLAHPGVRSARLTTPGDWVEFALAGAW